MNEEQDIAYELRVLSKRQDLPIDVIRTISAAYAEISQLRRGLVETQKALSKYAMNEMSRLDAGLGI